MKLKILWWEITTKEGIIWLVQLQHERLPSGKISFLESNTKNLHLHIYFKAKALKYVTAWKYYKAQTD